MTVEIGSKVQGKVTGITKFGAFVELPEGKTGLVHISEVADSYVKDVNDHLKVGDQVEVKVLSEKEGKISLSIKQTIDKPQGQTPSPIQNAHHVKVIVIVVLKTFVQRAILNQRKLLKIKWLNF